MFRFTIRDVLWLMVVVGVCSAWLLSSQRETVQRAKIEELGAKLDAYARSAIMFTLERQLNLERDNLKRERELTTMLRKEILAAQRRTEFESHYPIYFPPSPDEN